MLVFGDWCVGVTGIVVFLIDHDGEGRVDEQSKHLN